MIIKYDKQFIKCCNLSLYHKRKRVRKKNENRVDKFLKNLPDVITDVFI